MAKWKRGQSGNPKGKKRGCKDVRTEYRKLFSSRSPELINKVITLALQGNETCLKIAVDRICSPIRASSMPISPLEIPKTAGLSERAEIIFNAVSSGQLSAEDGIQLIAMLNGQAKMIELGELVSRIESLESEIKER